MDFPKEVMIEATNCCNSRCFFCGSTVSKRPRGFMDTALMLKLIDDAYSAGARKISFHGMGEPLLCKDLPNYVKRAKDLGYTYIYLDTNGVLAAPEIMNPTLEAGLDSLKFSIHAATAETYKRITGLNEFESVIENVRQARNYCDTKNLQCKIIAYFAISTINAQEAERFHAMMSPYAHEVWMRPIHNGSGVKLDNDQYAVEGQAEHSVSVCRELYDRMIINWEGNAIACCTDWTGDLIYGSVKDTSNLKELWNSEGLRHIRAEHKTLGTLRAVCARCMGYSRRG